MIQDRDVKVKKWDPRFILHSLMYDLILKIGVGPTQLTLNDIAFSNLKTVKVLIGAVGVAGCDFNFATADNVTEQPIDLGSIIPALARVIDVKTHTEVAFAHAATPIASWSVDTNVATIVTNGAHGLASGNSVVIAGMTETALNGTYTITRTSNTEFTIAKTHGDGGDDDDTGTVTFSAVALVAETGSATSGNQFITSATIKALNAITAQATGDALNNAPNAAATKVWVSATPDGKWNHITVGRLAVYITYLEA